MKAIGLIVCVNYHLADKLVDIKVPQMVFLDIIFEVLAQNKSFELGV